MTTFQIAVIVALMMAFVTAAWFYGFYIGWLRGFNFSARINAVHMATMMEQTAEKYPPQDDETKGV